MKKVGVISLGCDKNRVDTENMLGFLSGRHELTQDVENSDVVIINTCAFISSAREEAIETILDVAALKPKKIIVTGCLPQKYIGELFDELLEVDAFMGVGNYEAIADVIDRLFESDQRLNLVGEKLITDRAKRVITTSYHYAYLKIAEGCDNHCTYCTIPSIRGKYTSREFDGLVKECEFLVSEGAKEIILVAQDVTRYHEDLGANRLVELIREISRIEGVYKLRLMYCYPENVTDELIAEIKNNPKVAKYIDIPMQHSEDRILKLMGRRVTKQKLLSLIEKLRQNIEDIAIRSTFIVGFAGETEQDFEGLLGFLNQAKLDSVGFFAYSMEDGTPAARLSGQNDEEVKLERQQTAYAEQEEIAGQKLAGIIGKTIKVIYDGIDYDRQMLYGRSEYQSPDVDGKVFMHSDETLEIGNVYEVLVTGVSDLDLIAEVKR